MGPSYRLIFGLLADVWPVRIDADEFELALVNLVLNARDATPAGGEIRISAANVRLDGKSSPEHLTGDFVALSVADAGCGIPQDVLEKIFDPFFTTKGPCNGTGLGLAQVQGFAHQSGGTITVTSELRRGTIFTLYLPRSQTGRGEDDEDIAQNLSSTGILLLVEDNPDVAEATASLIEDLGFPVQIAGNAALALEILAKQDISVVVSDIVMAGSIDGVDLGRMVREKYPNLPMILITGYNNRSDEARDEFIVLRKPFSATDLARAIARIQSEASPQGATNVIPLTSRVKTQSPRLEFKFSDRDPTVRRRVAGNIWRKARRRSKFALRQTNRCLSQFAPARNAYVAPWARRRRAAEFHYRFRSAPIGLRTTRTGDSANISAPFRLITRCHSTPRHSSRLALSVCELVRTQNAPAARPNPKS